MGMEKSDLGLDPTYTLRNNGRVRECHRLSCKWLCNPLNSIDGGREEKGRQGFKEGKNAGEDLGTAAEGK